ncbi:hypothetical protein GALL_270430 [mine drainage metagenome]|uniref:Uncharacterized protein n=1 Tax=mine drainage metagenome TaxID=410659 RepID=A0A1J5RSN7_9ZZZZ
MSKLIRAAAITTVMTISTVLVSGTAFAQAANPCAKAANPCAKAANPCAKAANPCAKQ